MGLFDWIGEAIGGACHALAEFIADGFKGIFSGLGSMAKGISNDLMKDVVSTAQDPSSEVHQGAKKLHETASTPITQGFDHTVAELSKRHSEITPDQANKECQQLYEQIRADAGKALVSNIAIEAGSLGQIEGPMESYRFADKISGATQFAHSVAMMKYQAQWLTAYEYYLNIMNPNKKPGPSDLIRFAYREVWDPTRRSELLEESYPGRFAQEMMHQGFNQEWADSFWASHWDIPSVGQLNEMLHRGVIDEEDWDRFIKYNDFDPKVRPWLKAISYNPYTRVDVRRMYDLALVTDQEVYKNYKDQGYDDIHAQRMTIWTKVYTLSVELAARYSKGWINENDILQELISAGMPSDRAKIWIQKIVKTNKETRTTTERDLTKSEIVKGVKNGFLSMLDAIDLLVDMGYSQDEAEYIIAINVEALTGSPKTYEEFENLVNLRRKSQGLPPIKHKKEQQPVKPEPEK